MLWGCPCSRLFPNHSSGERKLRDVRIDMSYYRSAVGLNKTYTSYLRRMILFPFELFEGRHLQGDELLVAEGISNVQYRIPVL